MSLITRSLPSLMSSSSSTPIHTPTHTPTHTPVHTPSQRRGMSRQWICPETIEGASNMELVLIQTRRWIEECTGCVQEERSYREYLQDGTVLCKLIQRMQPHLIRKVNHVKSPFAWRENLIFFVEACEKLGLKGSQIFAPEDLLNTTDLTPTYKHNSPCPSERKRKLGRVAATIYWLGVLVKDLPDYTGPLLDLDLSVVGELEPSSPVTRSKSNGLDLNFPTPTTPSYSPLVPRQPKASKLDSPIANTLVSAKLKTISEPLSTPNPIHSSPSVPLKQEKRKSKQSPTVRVRKVESVISQTDKQSFAQIVLYLGNSNKNRKGSPLPNNILKEEGRATPEEVPSIEDLTKSDRRLVEHSLEEVVSPEPSQETSEGHHKRAPVNETVERCVQSEQEESGNPSLLVDLVTTDQNRRDSLHSSTTSPSEVSTVIARDQASSRCSGSFVSSDREDFGTNSSTGRSEFSETESSFSSPLVKQSTSLVFTHDNPLSPAAFLADTQEDIHSAQFSPAQLSNPPESATVDSTGLLPLEFRSELGSSSQAAPYFSPRDSETAFHFDLSQSQYSQSEETGDFGLEGVRALGKCEAESVFDTSPPVVAPPVGFGGSHLGLIFEEPEVTEAISHTSQSSSTLAGRSTKVEPLFEGNSPGGSREASSKSGLSSTSSIDSSSCSVIVVSYPDVPPGGESISDIPCTPANTSYDSCDSDECFVNSTERESPTSDLKQSFTIIEETEKNTDMAGRAQVLTIYPSSVPHHSLTLSSSASSTGPDSPSPSHQAHKSSSRSARTLHVVPSGGSSQATVTKSPEKDPGAVTSEVGYEELNVTVVLLPGEKRLGFNLAGGRDQGTFPQVESIAGASPAARSNLRCGDELLSVDGMPLHSTVHKEATSILHNAASKGRMILRVRRRVHDQATPLDRNSSENSLGPPIMAIMEDTTEQELSSSDTTASTGAIHPVDLSRVKSDALPHTLHAKMVMFEGSGVIEEHKGDVPDFLSDINSTAVEVGSSACDSVSEKLSFTESHRSMSSVYNDMGSHPELNTERVGEVSETLERGNSTSADDAESEQFSIMESILAVARRHSEGFSQQESKEDTPVEPRHPTTRSNRPISAPSRRSTSSGAMQVGSSSTLPTSMRGSQLKEKRASVDEERLRRRANIEVGARAAMKYSTKHKLGKTDSLPSYFRTSNVNSFLVLSDDDIDEPESEQSEHTRTSSSPVQPTTPSTPLNLRNLSIDETRMASLSEMDAIWHQVEGHSDEALPLPPKLEVAPALESPSRHSPVLGHPIHDLSSSSRESADGSSAKNGVGPLPMSSVVVKPRADEEAEEEVFEQTDLGPPPISTQVRSSATLPTHSSLGGATAAPTVSVGGTRMSIPDGRTKSLPRGIESLLSSLRSLNEKVGTHDEAEEFKLLEEMLQSNTFRKAKEFHDDMCRLLEDDNPDTPRPLLRRVVPLAQSVRHQLRHHTQANEPVDELRALMKDPHIQALLFCHDKISTHDLHVPSTQFPRVTQDPVDLILSSSVHNLFSSARSSMSGSSHLCSCLQQDVSSSFPRDGPSTRKENAVIVFLERTNRPLGCTIYKQDDAVFIGKLLKNCDAEQSDVLREGDELLEVNGIPLTGRSTDEIVRLMSGEAGSTLALTIIPVHDDNVDLDYEPKYVRAHFNYNGRLDEEIPCKALGLAFQKGDILEVSNQDDPNWWQVRKIFDDGAESLPGLIPARHLQQKRESLIRSYPMSPMLAEKYRKKGFKSMFSKKRKKKIFYQQTPHGSAVAVGDEVATYEDVVRVDPNPERMRPILLIGAPGVGRRTLIRKLLKSDSNHFAPVIQHTSRPIRPGEVNGHDYYFVTRDEFERDAQQDRFLEYGDLRGHYYGTAYSSIKKIMEGGRVPVLDLHPQALKVVRNSGLKPYIIFIASPRLERLHITRRVGSEKQKRRSIPSSHDHEEAQLYTEADLQHLVEESYLIENQYSHYFDWVIVNDDFQVASDMLKEVARRVEDEPQWVPVNWLMDLSQDFTHNFPISLYAIAT